MISLASPLETTEGMTAEFDNILKAMNDGLNAQFDALRAIATDAEARRQHDADEIARLNSELTERNETIQSMQQALRALADNLGTANA